MRLWIAERLASAGSWLCRMAYGVDRRAFCDEVDDDPPAGLSVSELNDVLSGAYDDGCRTGYMEGQDDA